MIHRVYLLLILVVAVCACGLINPPIRITVEFRNDKNLQQGNAVLHQGMPVGVVDEVTREAGKIRVELKLDAEKAAGIRQNAVALVNTQADPVTIDLINPPRPGDLIADNSSIRGLDSHLELLGWQAGNAAGAFADALSGAAKTIDSYFQSDQWKSQKRHMSELLNSLPEQSEAIGKELEQEFNGLLQELETESGPAMEQLEEDLDKLTGNLEELQKKLLEQGKKNITGAIDDLIKELNKALEQRRLQEERQGAI